MLRSLFLQDAFGPSITAKEKIFYFLVMGFVITLFFRTMPVLNNIFIGLIVVTSFFYNSLQEKWQLLRQRKAVPVMLLFFLVHIISTAVSHNREEALVMLQMRSPLLLFPIALGLMVVKEHLKQRIWWLYGVATTVAALVCLIAAIVAYRQTGNAGVLYNDSLTVAIGKQSIYFAMMINFAIAGFIYLLAVKSSFVNRGMAWCSILFLLFIHFLLASRISIIILYSGLLLYAFYYIVKKRKILEGATLVVGLCIAGFLLVKFFPQTFNRFRELGYTEYSFKSQAAESHYSMEVTADQWNGANIRLAVWKCGWELARQHLVWGVQLGDKMDELIKVYQSKGFVFAVQSKRNLHNNYLDILVTFGLVGLILFVVGWLVLPLLQAVQARDALGCFVILALAVAFISETYVDRSIGNVVMAFFIPFVITAPGNKSA